MSKARMENLPANVQTAIASLNIKFFNSRTEGIYSRRLKCLQAFFDDCKVMYAK